MSSQSKAKPDPTSHVLSDAIEVFRLNEARDEASFISLINAGGHPPFDLARAMHRLAWYYSNNARHEEALPYLLNSLEIFRSLNLPAREAKVVTDIGRVYKAMRRYEELLAIIEAVLERCTPEDIKETGGHLYLDRATCLTRIGRYLEASENLHFCITFARAEGQKHILEAALAARAAILQALGDADGAKHEYLECLSNALASADRRNEFTARWGLMINRFTARDFPACREQLIEIKTFVDIPGKEAWIVLGNVFDVMMQQMEGLDPRKAIEKLVVLHADLSDRGIPALSAVAAGALAEAHLSLSLPAEAAQWAMVCVECHSQHADSVPIADAYDLLARCHSAANDYPSALAAMAKRVELAYKVAIEEKRRLIDLQNLASKIHEVEDQRDRATRELAGAILQVSAQRDTLVDVETLARNALDSTTPLTRSTLKGLLRLVRRAEMDDNLWSKFRTEFSSTYPRFQIKVLERGPDISTAELRVAMLLRSGLGTKEIANALGVTDRTIELHRSMLRKKLRLESRENLVTALIKLGE